MAKYYVDNNGNYLGAFEGVTGKVPQGAIEVPSAPSDARSTWNGSVWSTPVLTDSEKFVQEGVTDHDMIEALWQELREDNPALADAIQAKRNSARSK